MVSPIEFKIVILRSADGFDVMAETESSGRAGPEPLDWKSLQDPGFQALLTQIRDKPLVTRFEGLRTVGETLFDAVFTGNVRRLFVGLFDQRVEPQPDGALRLRFDITESAAELAILPWEFLFWRGTPICTQLQTLLVRDLASIEFGSRGSLTMTGKPRVLLIIPRGSDLQTERERDRIQGILDRAKIPCDVLEGRVTLQSVDDLLAEREYHILHFIGHGDADVGDDGRLQGRLRFNTTQDDITDTEWVEEERIQALLSSHRSLRLVVLNVCEGGRTDTSDRGRSGRGFIGLAPAIMRAGIPAVVAMQYEILDSVAIQFAETFYKRLTSERWAGEVDKAVNLARKACYLGSRDDRGFATPVLFLHTKDGQLFVFSDPTSTPDPAIPPPEPAPSLTGFLGREKELDDYGRILAEKHFAVITGMPGVGKSLLAAKLAEKATANSEKRFWHRFHAGEGVEILIWKLAALLARNSRLELWRLLNQPRSAGDAPLPIDMLLDHLFEMLPNQGYVLCLDDFQHVDADPLMGIVIDRLAEVVHAGEIKLIITSRRMPDFVTTVRFDPLSGLARHDAAALLSARGVRLAEALFSSLYEQTAGNAELLNLAIAILEQTSTPERLVAQLVAAEDVENYLLREVDEYLTEAERLVMSAVAVLLGQPGTRSVIEYVLGGESALRTLRQLCNRYLLTEADGEAGKVYSQHAMVQRFYYELLGQHRRQEMHARAAAYYESEEVDVLRAARHYRLAGDFERSAQLATSDVSGALNRGQMHLLRELLAQYQQVQVGPQTWAQVLSGRGQAAYAYGDYDMARRHFQAAQTAAEALPTTADVRLLRAQVCRRMGGVLIDQAAGEALSWFRQGLDHLAGDSPAMQADLLIACGAALIHLGQFDAAETEIAAGLALLPAEAVASRIDALLNLSVIYSSRGDLARSIACTTEALPLAEQRGDLFRLIKLYNSRAVDRIFCGEWANAVGDFQQALHLGEQVGSKSEQAKVDLNLGSLYCKMGDEQTALIYWAKSLELARKNDLHEMICAVQVSAAEVYIWQGELAQAEAALAEAQMLAERHGFKDLLPEIWRKRSQLRLQQGRRDEAVNDVRNSTALAEQMSLDVELGISLRVQAEIEMAQTPASMVARGYLERSLALLEAAEQHEAGRARVTLGQALLAQGDGDAARRHWSEASDAFRGLGAKRDLAIVGALLLTVADTMTPDQANGGGE